MGGFYHILSKYHPILMFSVVELWETWHFQTVISRKNLVVREFLPATCNTSCCEPQPCKICLVSSNWFDQQLIVLFTNQMCLCNHLIAWIDSSTIFSVPFTAHFLWWSSWPKMAFLSHHTFWMLLNGKRNNIGVQFMLEIRKTCVVCFVKPGYTWDLLATILFKTIDSYHIVVKFMNGFMSARQ